MKKIILLVKFWFSFSFQLQLKGKIEKKHVYLYNVSIFPKYVLLGSQQWYRSSAISASITTPRLIIFNLGDVGNVLQYLYMRPNILI